MLNLQTKSFISNYRHYYGSLLRLGLPVLVTQIGIILVSFADTMMVGRYGVDELAAAAFVNSLFIVPVVMQIGFAGGITPLIGALFSRGDTQGTGRTLRAGTEMNIAVSFSFTAIMSILYFFLDRFGQPEELLPLIRSYYLILLPSLLPLAIFNVFQQTSNGVTDTAMPMWLILLSNLINICGNYLLIFGKAGCPELGLAGAGISTLTARIISTILIIVIYKSTRRYRDYMIYFSDRSSLGELRRKVWKTSYPVMIQSGIECSLWSFGAIVCGWFGKIQLAAYQVVNTIAQLGYMIYMSFGIALSVKVANFTGVKDFGAIKRVTMAGVHLILGLATLASIFFLLFTHSLIGIFATDTAVIAAGTALVIPLVLYQYGDAVQITYCNALRGTSYVKPLLWISLGCYWGIGIPLLYLMAMTWPGGAAGVYTSFFFALACAGISACLIFYRTLRKLQSAPY